MTRTTLKYAKTLALSAQLAFGAFAAQYGLDDCRCRRPEKDDSTRAGANQFIVRIEEGAYRSLKGTVEMYDARPLEHVLVEILDHPEYLLSDRPLQPATQVTQKRLAACLTSADDKFCFRDLPSGRYELRSSLDGGWNISHVYVVVEKKAGKRKNLHIKMSVGT